MSPAAIKMKLSKDIELKIIAKERTATDCKIQIPPWM